jgi:hypothetical protein
VIGIGFVALLAGYTFAYWGGNLLIGNHISFSCLAFNVGCSTNSSNPNAPGTGSNPGGQGNNPQGSGNTRVPSLTSPPVVSPSTPSPAGPTPIIQPTQP